MIRTLLAIIAGQITIALLNGIVRMAIGTYLDIEFSLSGVTFLPGFTWEVVVVAMSLIYGFVAAIIVCLIAKENSKIEILGLTLIVTAVGLFDYYYIGASEPLWYFLINTGLIISGLFLGYRFMLANEHILKQKIK
ncbi:MAG: hypothetical protein ACNS64_08770 [Candidatus Halalkalibacterium sp. M3_1C_030]